MWFQVTGIGALVDLEDDIEPPPAPLTVRVEARNEDYLLAEYGLFEGLWVGAKFAYFQDEPDITPLPEDQNLKLMGAPMLPGFSV